MSGSRTRRTISITLVTCELVLGALECAIVRASVIISLFIGSIAFFSTAAAVRASAEVIHLKNGRTIWADHVHENGAHLEYDIGDNSYAILQSTVDHIEAGGMAPISSSSAAGANSKDLHDVPAFAPSDNVKDDLASISELTNKIIRDNAIDTDALTTLEKEGNANRTAAAYYIAAKHEYGHQNFAQSRTYFETALHFDPDNPAILNYYAALLIRTGKATEALPHAEHAARLAPDSPDALAVLGYAQFASDHNQDAIRTWKRSLALRPDTNIQQYLATAEREASAEADYSQRESSHFTLRYEGKQTSESLRGQLIATLESQYDDLVRELGIAPRSSIAVVLYTDQTFFDVTQAPSWTGAVNDGKLRIPVQGLSSVTPELARVLKHELAHSFINQLSAGRCPQWLNEGIAQAVEPKSLSSNGSRLAQLFRSEHEIPFNAMEGSFMRFSGIEAALAYDESLAAVQYINETYGMGDLQRILERLGEGSSIEAALRSTIHSDYRQLDEEVGKYLVRKYGN
jgi:tetratricopeptide (TPR) repeat protein